MTLKYLFTLLVIYLLSTGCAKQQFSNLAKAKAISNPVFGENNDVGEENNNNGDHGSSLLCSDSRTATVGYNLVSAAKLELRVVDKAGNIVCKNSDTDYLRNEIVNNRTIPIPSCGAMTENKYTLRLVDPTKKIIASGTDLLNFSGQKSFIVRESTESVWSFLDGSSKHNKHNKQELEVLYNNNKSNDHDANCDQRASPLIVKTINEDHSGIQLTSQREGILFDILGENSRPWAHAKKRISWITKNSYQFLVKPDRRGKVHGIDEMFGDNTKGPDGEFADNGYMALAKYDLNGDGVIDSRDAIYKSLKLWSDKNRDGRSQKGELVSLEDAGLIAIDLEYDDNFRETDQYGNETRMKSVVKYSDDSYRLIFDLWFNYEGKRYR